MSPEKEKRLLEVIDKVEKIYMENKVDFEYNIQMAKNKGSGIRSRQIYAILQYLIEENII